MKQLKIFMLAISGAVAVAAALVSCAPLLEVEEKKAPPGPYDFGGMQVNSVTVNAATGEEIYLVKFNPSSINVPAYYTGSARSVSSAGLPSANMRSFSENGTQTGEQPSGLGLERHSEMLRLSSQLSRLSAASGGEEPSRNRGLSRSVAFIPPTLNQSKAFWVESGWGGPYVQITAKYVAAGTKCRVWVASQNLNDSSSSSTDNKITTTQAQNLAGKFDQIYIRETAFFGYERGGGAGGDGGIDGDPLVNILVCDIDSDGQGGGTIGMFGAIDEYSQDYLNTIGYGNYKSNQMEIFYMDTYFLDSRPNLAYSTLIHEFQHMIHYNQKMRRLNAESETWYNEMLSMLAEDMLDQHIGVSSNDNDHPIQARILAPTYAFKNGYWKSGVTEWLGGYDVLYSYATAYAFGAYLARNYGGAKLLYEMAHNNAVNVDSVDAALAAVGGGNFASALEKFPETLLNTMNVPVNYSNGVLMNNKIATFNHAAPGSAWTSPPAGITASNYSFEAFNIGAITLVQTSQAIGPHGIAIQRLNVPAGTDVSVTYYLNSPVKMYLLKKKSNGTVERISGVYP